MFAIPRDMFDTPSPENNFCIIPKIAYIEVEVTASVESFLDWWWSTHSVLDSSEEPTQKDYDSFVKSALEGRLAGEWRSLPKIKLRQDN